MSKFEFGIAAVDTNSLVKNAGNLGFTNLTDSCLSSLNPPIVCSNPDQYVYWDSIHPTAIAHEKIANLAFKSIPHPTKVPESGIVFGLMGFAAVATMGVLKNGETGER